MGQAQQIRAGTYIVLKRDSARTGMFYVMTVNVDTTGLKNWFVIDSLGALINAMTVREEIQFTGIANFNNAADDSTVLQVYGQAHSGQILVYSMYLDRFALNTAKPGRREPTTFRDDLPIVTADSMFVYHIGRHSGYSAGSRGFISVYKVAIGIGLSPAVTTGTFYDMVKFDEATVYPNPGTSVQLNVQLSLKKRR